MCLSLPEGVAEFGQIDRQLVLSGFGLYHSSERRETGGPEIRLQAAPKAKNMMQLMALIQLNPCNPELVGLRNLFIRLPYSRITTTQGRTQMRR
jgi:hypothetical protein